MKPILAGLCAVALFAATGVSQKVGSQSPKGTTPKVTDPTSDPERDAARAAKKAHIEAKIARMREMLRQGKLIRSHVRVTVRLTNGNKLQGVVKDGQLIERVDGLRFVAAEAGARGAGIRVWYYDDTNSYIFLPYDRVQRYWVGEKLTEEQVKNIEAELVAREDLARKRYQELMAERAREQAKNQPAPSEVVPKEKKDVVGALEAAEQQRLMAIYAEFPPEEGWSAAKKKNIEVRRITVGAFPDEKSRRFLAVFDDWVAAKALAEKVAAGNDDGDQSKPGGRPAVPKPVPTPAPGGAPKK